MISKESYKRGPKWRAAHRQASRGMYMFVKMCWSNYTGQITLEIEFPFNDRWISNWPVLKFSLMRS